MESPILQGLNPAQRAAVEAYDSASLIIAGAGSGKTRVLTSRIAYMIQKGIKPKNILATTFTNKAAQEMRERIVKMIPEHLTEGQARHIWMGTFHSIFARILRTDAERIGFPTNFTIYDASDARNLIKTIVKELNLADDTSALHPQSLGGREGAAHERVEPAVHPREPRLPAVRAAAVQGEGRDRPELRPHRDAVEVVPQREVHLARGLQVVVGGRRDAQVDEDVLLLQEPADQGALYLGDPRRRRGRCLGGLSLGVGSSLQSVCGRRARNPAGVYNGKRCVATRPGTDPSREAEERNQQELDLHKWSRLLRI